MDDVTLPSITMLPIGVSLEQALADRALFAKAWSEYRDRETEATIERMDGTRAWLDHWDAQEEAEDRYDRELESFRTFRRGE